MFMKREKEVVKVKDDFEVWNELNEKAK
jgi:hypothetical protein